MHMHPGNKLHMRKGLGWRKWEVQVISKTHTSKAWLCVQILKWVIFSEVLDSQNGLAYRRGDK